MAELTYLQAISDGLRTEMRRDKRVFVIGEDVGVYGGAFQVTGDLIERYGADRVIDTPISELGGAGVAIGAAMTGLLDAAKEVNESGSFAFVDRSTPTAELLKLMRI